MQHGSMHRTGYSEPRITDYGTLVELTADFDLNFAGSVARAVTLAQVSMPIGDLPGEVGEPTIVNEPEPTIVDNPPDTTIVNNPPSGDAGVLPGGPIEGGGPGGGAPSGGGEVRGDGPIGGGGGAPGGAAGVPAAGGGAGGKLPFTGYPALLAAGAGALLTTAGVVVRSKLRRRS